MALSSDPLEVFISWSKKPSDDVAAGLAALLTTMFDNVNPWYSAGDIEPGTRGIPEIQTRLARTRFGVLIVTSHNQGSPWINFEAGALAKTITEDTSTRVVPLLIDLTVADLDPGPLTGLQAVVADEAGARELVDSIAGLVGVAPAAVDARWRSAWPTFQEILAAARTRLTAGEQEPRRTDRELLEELLELQRQTARILDLGANLPSFGMLDLGDNARLKKSRSAGGPYVPQLIDGLKAVGLPVRTAGAFGGGVTVSLAGPLSTSDLGRLAFALNDWLTRSVGSLHLICGDATVVLSSEARPVTEEMLIPLATKPEPSP